MNIEIYKAPKGHKREGMWTFKIDDKESLIYSDQKRAIEKRITALINGPEPGTIRLRALKSTGKKSEAGVNLVPETNSPFDLPTMEERIEAFFSRGKLADPKYSSSRDTSKTGRSKSRR